MVPSCHSICIWLQDWEVDWIFFWGFPCILYLSRFLQKICDSSISCNKLSKSIWNSPYFIRIGDSLSFLKNSRWISINSLLFSSSFLLLATLASLINCLHLSGFKVESIVHIKDLSRSSSFCKSGKYWRSSGTSFTKVHTGFTPNSLYLGTVSIFACLCSID